MLPHWLTAVFSHPDPRGMLLIAGKTTIIYFFLVVGLRLLGKRELGQMTIYDLVLIIVLANAVQNAMVGDDNSLVGGLVSATTLLILNRLFNLILSRSRRVERAMVGGPILLIHHGHILAERMRKEQVTHEQLMAALREHGLVSPDQAELCVLEVDGSLSIVPNDATIHRTRRHFRALRIP